MATGERPFSSGKLKISAEYLATKIYDVETQLVLHEDILYPKRYMAQLAFRTAWEMQTPDSKELEAIDGLAGNSIMRGEWLRQRAAFKKTIIGRLDTADRVDAYAKALDEWNDAKHHEGQLVLNEFNELVPYSNGYTRFVSPVRMTLAALANSAVGLQVGDYSRDVKKQNYAGSVGKAHSLLDDGLFMSFEDVKSKELAPQMKNLDNIIHLNHRLTIYKTGDAVLRSVRIAQRSLTDGELKKLHVATPEEGSDDIITESIEIPELIAA